MHIHIKKILLTIFIVITALLTVFTLWKSREQDPQIEIVSDASDMGIETTSAIDYQASVNMLTKNELNLLADLQQSYDSEELKKIFNPQSSMEFDQASRENMNKPFDSIDFANRSYDRDWSEFVDGLGLNAENARIFRDNWIEFTARKSELLMETHPTDLHEPEGISDSLEDAEMRFAVMLSKVLSPEQIAAFHAHEEQVQLAFHAQTQSDYQEMIDNGYTGIILAAGSNDLPTVYAYLASGADPNRLTADGYSAMHKAATDNNTEILRALIDSGANVNLTIPGGNSALWSAATAGNTEAVLSLVEAGANLSYRNSGGNPLATALKGAAMSGNAETVRVLLEAGADATGIAGEWALIDAIRFGNREMEQMLIDAGAPADSPQVAEQRRFFDLGLKLKLIDD